jgi:chloramphenicol-sensitive protein RarD
VVLATSFAVYALLKKRMRGVGPIESLAVEVTLVLVPALVYLTILGLGGEGAFGAAGLQISILLVLTGVATALPLLLFGAAAGLIKLSTIGLLQYIAPSLQFLIGVFVYGEVVGRDRLIGFVLVWFALALYTGHGLARLRRGEPQPLAV